MDKFNEDLTTDIRFTPYAWQKMLYFFNKGDTEVSGFGITEEDDSLVTDFRIVEQTCSVCETEMTTGGLADYLDKMVDEGFSPNQCMRIWCHCHPGSSPHPSGTDEHQFTNMLNNQPWAVMFIISNTMQVYCRLGVNQGPGAVVELTAGVDWTQPIQYEVDFKELEKEYKEKVNVKTYSKAGFSSSGGLINSEIKYSENKYNNTKYGENYNSINWNPDDALANRWGKGYNDYGYTENDRCDDDEPSANSVGESLDESDIEHCFQEYLDKEHLDKEYKGVAEKPLHEMTEDEFQRFRERE